MSDWYPLSEGPVILLPHSSSVSATPLCPPDELFDDFLHLFLFDAGGFGYLPRLHRLGQEIQNLFFHGVWSLSVMSIAA